MRAAFVLAVVAASPALAKPAGSLNELFAQFRGCLAPPAGALPEMAPVGAQTGEVTLRFSLRRDGALVGRPHITFARLPAGEAQKRVLLEAFAAALDRCLPVQITDALGGAIAGRPLTLRVNFGARERGI